MAHDSGYINLFSFADWATSASNALKASGIGELSTDAARGEITITTGGTAHVWTAIGDSADYYMMPVRGGTTYDVTWTMSGSSANSQVFYVPMRADRTYCLGGSHYQSVAPGSGPGEKSGSFTTPADCRYVQLFFDVHDTHKSMTFGDIAVWGKPFVRFGRSDCSPIIVEKFAPICSFEGVEGSEPLALDVPVVPFVPPVPPPECACFTFEKGRTGAVEVEMTCDDKAELHVEVEIEQGCSDCCAGKYTIKPTASLTLPCIPFDIAEADVQIMRRDYKTGGTTAAGPGEVDGTAGFTLERGKNKGEDEGEEADCCTLKPTLTVTFPDCVKHFEPTHVYPSDGQVQFYRRNDDPESADYGKAQLQHKTFIEWFVDREHCSEYPRITTLDIPSCMLPDKNWPAKTVEIRNNNGNTLIGTLTYKVSRVDCAPRVEIGVSKFTLPDPPIYVPPAPCASPNGKLEVTAQYVDAAGATKKIVNASAGNGKTAKSSIVGSRETPQDPYSCLKYDSDMTLDLGHMYGIGFNNGGGVGIASDNMLHIDGDTDEGVAIYYCGGYGDWTTSAAGVNYDEVFSRGPIKRYGKGCIAGATDPSPFRGVHAVPVATVESRFAVWPAACNKEPAPKTCTDASWSCAQEWSSGRLTTGATVNGVKQLDTYTPGSGHLDVVCPTGAQWHPDGLSVLMPLTEFAYNSSGILSKAKEHDVGLCMAPGPLSKKRTSGDDTTYLNCSGLASISYTGDPHAGTDGLRVNAGKGLWIYGYSGDPDHITGYDLNRQGRLEVAKHDDDFTFVDVTDVDKVTCPRLVLNDVKTDTTANQGKAVADTGTIQTYAREGDFTVPVLMFDKTDKWYPAASGNGVYIGTKKDTYSIMKDHDDLKGLYNKLLTANANSGIVTVSGNKLLASQPLINYLQGVVNTIGELVTFLGSLRGTYMHFGKAGMLMGIDGNTDCTQLTRRSTVRQSNNQQSGS